MSSSTNQPEEDPDWEITPEGLYIARRAFLVRRGYCCANRCRNCPYINWREQAAWQPAPALAIRRGRVSPKALDGARAALAMHQQALSSAPASKLAYHQEMIAHYQRLLEHWW
ncbi:MAG TPA: DUF5522 domain-containing protein [Ktedonobacteraceae bacterium]